MGRTIKNKILPCLLHFSKYLDPFSQIKKVGIPTFFILNNYSAVYGNKATILALLIAFVKAL